MAKNSDSTVVLRDIDIPFLRMIMIMLKFMFASIPAMIIFYAVLTLIMIGVVMLFGGSLKFLEHVLPFLK